MHPQDHPYFNLSQRAHDLINSPEMKHSLARAGAKEAWIGFLQNGTANGFEETDRIAMDRVLDFINTYALLIAFDQFHTNEAVNAFMDILEKMTQGQDLQNEMAQVVAQLPEEFKDAVHKASLHAQAFLLSKMLAIN